MDNDLILPMWAPGVVMRTQNRAPSEDQAEDQAQDQVEDPDDHAEAQMAAGSALPELSIELTPDLIVSTSLAAGDLTPVHDDVEGTRGPKDVLLTILTTMGLVERYVTDWAGPETLIRGIKVKLGAPAYAGDTLTLSGTVTAVADGELTVEVRGMVGPGAHATGTVRLLRP